MKSFFYTLICIGIINTSFAQQNILSGNLSGSFESYTQLYQKDEKINAILPQDRVGSNNYLKLDYNYKQFTVGIQFESYLPTVAGYPFSINESKIANKYFKYTAKKFSLQVGDFYEQFGSGLIYRSWENRQIGINNALEGVNVQVKPVDFIKLKVVYGRMRNVFSYSNSVIRGADVEFDLSQIKKSEIPAKTKFALGFSYVSRYQQYTGPDPNFPPTAKAAAVRMDIQGQVASLSLEYVHKQKDPHVQNNFDMTTGKAFLVNASYAKNKLGINLNFRGMENMDFRGEREATGSSMLVNYIPALTRQHDYLTTNIYLYNPQVYGEIGGQFELFYNFSKKPSKSSKLALNFSHYRSLDDPNNILSFGDEKYFQDLNVEWKKKWNSKWNTILAFHNVFHNKSVIEGGVYDNIKANIVLLNATYKYAKTKSFRFELQHLSTEQDNGNWAAAVAEFSFAPKWIVYVSDLYNYGKTDLHYPVVGGSYSKSGTRFGLSYGRQRAGLLCVGGVCRFVPAASGLTATLTTTFN